MFFLCGFGGVGILIGGERWAGKTWFLYKKKNKKDVKNNKKYIIKTSKKDTTNYQQLQTVTLHYGDPVKFNICWY